MNRFEIEKIGNSAIDKVFTLKNDGGKYLISSMIAGAFASIGIIIAFTIGSIFAKYNSPAEKLVGAVTFSIALMLIVFTGTELFTGNNMTMVIGRLSKKVKTMDVMNVWIATWLGNMFGTIFAALIFVGSGLANKGLTMDYFSNISLAKLSLSPLEMFFRGLLCNFLVCMAIFMTKKLKNEVAQMIAICLIIIAFFVSGFEHSIANMAIYSIAYISGAIASVSLANIYFALLMVTLGNIVGGGFFVGAVFYRLSTKRKIKESDELVIRELKTPKFI